MIKGDNNMLDIKYTMDFMLKGLLITSLLGVAWQYFLLYLSHTDIYLKLIHIIRWIKFIMSIIFALLIMIIIILR